MLDMETLTRKIVDEPLDRGCFVKLHQPPPTPDGAGRRFGVATGTGLRFAGLRQETSPSGAVAPSLGSLAGDTVESLRMSTEQMKIGVRIRKRTHGNLLDEVLHRLLIPFAHLDEIGRQFADRIALREISLEVAAMPPDSGGELVELLQQFENVLELFRAELAPIGEMPQPDIFAAETDEDFV